MTELNTYAGGCHCGHVRYQAQADLDHVLSCNCSICTQRGLLLTFLPAEQFHLESGGEDLTEYRFNKHRIQHLFCPVCGIEAFARGKGPEGSETIALNVRSIDGVDVSKLQPKSFDGRSL
jgi:hypothetical protein